MNNSVFRSEVEKVEAEAVGLELGTGEEAMALTCEGGHVITVRSRTIGQSACVT